MQRQDTNHDIRTLELFSNFLLDVVKTKAFGCSQLEKFQTEMDLAMDWIKRFQSGQRRIEVSRDQFTLTQRTHLTVLLRFLGCFRDTLIVTKDDDPVIYMHEFVGYIGPSLEYVDSFIRAKGILTTDAFHEALIKTDERNYWSIRGRCLVVEKRRWPFEKAIREANVLACYEKELEPFDKTFDLVVYDNTIEELDLPSPCCSILFS